MSRSSIRTEELESIICLICKEYHKISDDYWLLVLNLTPLITRHGVLSTNPRLFISFPSFSIMKCVHFHSNFATMIF